MIPSTLVFLTRSDVARVLTLSDCIEAVESVFREEALGKIPPPGILGFHVPDGGFHIKAAGYGPYFAAKVNGNFPGNPDRHGLPTIQGMVALFDSTRGTPLALMDSIEITAQRTAAASAVAARHLARKDSAVATIVGCGAQGRFQLEAINLVRPLRQVFAVDTEEERSGRFAREMSGRLGIPVAQAALEQALAASDLVVTCTPSRRAFVASGMLRPGAFVAAVGTDNPAKQEIEPGLMAGSTVVVDHLEQCLSMGDLHHAISAGAMQARDVQGTLGEVIAGVKPGRRSDTEIMIFDSTGTALQDVAAAVLVYQRALRDGIGVPVLLGS
jgi:alanine dehydrogenase